MHDSCVCITCKKGKMTLLKGKHSLLRYLGFIAAIFACIQAIIWLNLSFAGIICFYIQCGITRNAMKFGKTFNNIYMNIETSKEYPHIVSPIFFHVIMWLYVIISLIWIYASLSLIVDFRKWNDGKRLRKSSKRWIIITIAVCVFDILVFILFVVDFSLLKNWDLPDTSARRSGESIYKYYTTGNMWNNPIEYDYDDIENSTKKIKPSQFIEPENTTQQINPMYVAELKKKFDKKRKTMENELKSLRSAVDLILATELNNYNNPLVRLQTAGLVKRLQKLEEWFLKDGQQMSKLGNETSRTAFEDDFFNNYTRRLFKRSMYDSLFRGPSKNSFFGASELLLAPSGTMMTLAIRGFILWIFNLSAALFLLYLYNTRPRRPTLITRIQG